MKSEAQRIAIAEACGWTRIDPKSGLDWEPRGLPPNQTHGALKDLPDYTEDLNACHEMEKVLTEERRNGYALRLYDLTNGFKPDHYEEDPYNPICFEASMIGVGLMVSANAAQRAEAFLRTIGKWVES